MKKSSYNFKKKKRENAEIPGGNGKKKRTDENLGRPASWT